MIEHSAFVEEEREGGDTYQKHLFVHIGERSEYSDPSLEVRNVSREDAASNMESRGSGYINQSKL